MVSGVRGPGHPCHLSLVTKGDSTRSPGPGAGWSWSLRLVWTLPWLVLLTSTPGLPGVGAATPTKSPCPLSPGPLCPSLPQPSPRTQPSRTQPTMGSSSEAAVTTRHRTEAFPPTTALLPPSSLNAGQRKTGRGGPAPPCSDSLHHSAAAPSIPPTSLKPLAKDLAPPGAQSSGSFSVLSGTVVSPSSRCSLPTVAIRNRSPWGSEERPLNRELATSLRRPGSSVEGWAARRQQLKPPCCPWGSRDGGPSPPACPQGGGKTRTAWTTALLLQKRGKEAEDSLSVTSGGHRFWPPSAPSSGAGVLRPTWGGCPAVTKGPAVGQGLSERLLPWLSAKHPPQRLGRQGAGDALSPGKCFEVALLQALPQTPNLPVELAGQRAGAEETWLEGGGGVVDVFCPPGKAQLKPWGAAEMQVLGPGPLPGPNSDHTLSWDHC